MSKLYLYSLEHALKNNEKEKLAASLNKSIRCREKLAASINTHYHVCEYRLDSDAIFREIAGNFGAERMLFHLALSLCRRSWDFRFSSENLAWAKNFLAERIPDEFCEPFRVLTLDETYTFLLNEITTKAREMYAD